MGKSAPRAPAAPDPTVTAQAQAAANQDTARLNAALNRVNQTTPYGSLTYSRAGSAVPWDENAYLSANPDVRAAIQPGGFTSGLDHYNRTGVNENRGGVAQGYSAGAQDQWQANVALSPEQQQLYNLQTSAQQQYGQLANSQLQRLQGILGQPIDFSGAPGMAGAYQPGGAIGPTLTEDAWRAINPTITPEMMARIDPTITAEMMARVDPTITQYLQQGDIGDVQGTEQRQRVEDALFGRMQPQMDRDREMLESRLSNRGLAPGSEAYANAMGDFGRQQNDARLGVIAQGGQEQQLQASLANMLYGQRLGAAQNLFGQRLQGQAQQLQGAQGLFGQRLQGQAQQLGAANDLFGQQARNQDQLFNAQQALFGQWVGGRQLGMQEQAQQFGQSEEARKQYLSELLAQRQIPLNEISALMSGSQVQYPHFENTPQTNVAPTDVMGAYQMQQNALNQQYQGEMQGVNSFNQGLSGLLNAGILGGFMRWSDERLKEDIQRVGETDDGLPLYLFNYKGSGEKHVGPMAQDVEKVNPGAVVTDPASGFKAVDYQAALFGGKRRARR